MSLFMWLAVVLALRKATLWSVPCVAGAQMKVNGRRQAPTLTRTLTLAWRLCEQRLIKTGERF